VGSIPGAAVAQLYVSPSPRNTISRPIKELKGFTKVFLQPGEKKEVVIPLDRLATSFWDETLDCWVSEKGTYKIQVGQSSSQLCLTGSLEVEETFTWSGLDIYRNITTVV
jgi:beta-glucosidase